MRFYQTLDITFRLINVHRLAFLCSCIAVFFMSWLRALWVPQPFLQIFYSGENVFHLKFGCVVDGEVSDSSLILIQLTHRKVIFVHSRFQSAGLWHKSTWIAFWIPIFLRFWQQSTLVKVRERFSYCIKTHTSSYCWLFQKRPSCFP